MDTIKEDKAMEVISASHFEHTLWVNELRFFEDEIQIYEHQLERLVQKNDKSFLPTLERFQNKFIRQREVLDELKHFIRLHEQRLGWAVKNDDYNENAFTKDHEILKEKMNMFRELFGELKDNFYSFMIKNN